MSYDNINMRIIKPYKEFYNTAIRVVFQFGLAHLNTVSASDFVDAVQYHMPKTWKPMLKVPAGALFEWTTAVLCKLKRPLIITDFFDGLINQMMQYWDAEIIQKSNGFKRAKVEQ